MLCDSSSSPLLTWFFANRKNLALHTVNRILFASSSPATQAAAATSHSISPPSHIHHATVHLIPMASSLETLCFFYDRSKASAF
ncbi:hypothetical protein AAC387_Pa02g2414 [Persea americana]